MFEFGLVYLDYRTVSRPDLLPMSSPGNSGPYYVSMPIEPSFLNPPSADDSQRERRTLLRALTQLQIRATAAFFDFGPMRGLVERHSIFLVLMDPMNSPMIN